MAKLSSPGSLHCVSFHPALTNYLLHCWLAFDIAFVTVQDVSFYALQTSTTPIPSKHTIQPMKKADGTQVLASQRLNRPIAPHLSIYKWQVTSVNSSLQRITGAVLSGSLYLFAVSYLASPYLGWDLSSDSLSAAMASLPWAGKATVKFVIAWPFMFHVFNSLRHLAWDIGKGFAMKTVSQTGILSAGLQKLD
ncbi:succinate dehydrogenase cytochrome B subunit [Nannizzia gypsea CBS 118893]|uniref:Succinate dehydrogenase cytochrome B subunit n=1 Tax=Arthroderma gypseum (strain ATCC MYA-4604 / CBS 118893) TaxID=535722 RepID=E4URE0_ARTGP|nr:succinate dehydrogenase cytochrome B subunit [Nannizzia gypsea CBS 118893]EFR00203.1 succinate dehydrogenase cytochrome B subunit [Nannizzia gypsea CBS 118893]